MHTNFIRSHIFYYDTVNVSKNGKTAIGSRGAEFFLCWRQYFGAKIQLDTTSIASPPGHSQFISVHSLYGTIIIN